MGYYSSQATSLPRRCKCPGNTTFSPGPRFIPTRYRQSPATPSTSRIAATAYGHQNSSASPRWTTPRVSGTSLSCRCRHAPSGRAHEPIRSSPHPEDLQLLAHQHPIRRSCEQVCVDNLPHDSRTELRSGCSCVGTLQHRRRGNLQHSGRRHARAGTGQYMQLQPGPSHPRS